jgi:hypothetical protein
MNWCFVAITGITLASSMLYASPYVLATETAFTLGQVSQAHRLLEMWLECTECDRGELEGVGSLIATLERGPSQARREIMRFRLIRSYKQLAEYRDSNHVLTAIESEPEHIAHYMENYMAQYQIRAAIALARIGGPAARHALEKSLTTWLRKDVERAVSESLEKLRKISP